jgi:hypothetical protein
VFVLRRRRQYSGLHIRVRRAERFKRFASGEAAPTDWNRAATRAVWVAKVSTTSLREHTGQRFQADTSTESGEDSVGCWCQGPSQIVANYWSCKSERACEQATFEASFSNSYGCSVCKNLGTNRCPGRFRMRSSLQLPSLAGQNVCVVRNSDFVKSARVDLGFDLEVRVKASQELIRPSEN